MTIDFKKCTSERNHLTREFDGAAVTHTGTLRDSVSLMNPVITIPGTSDIAGYNYVDIPAFNRSYFVTDAPVLVNGMWEIHLHVDVIGTWLTEILECQAMVSEREKDANLWMDDGHAFTEAREINQYLYFSGTDEECYDVDDDGHTWFDPDGYQYYIIAQGPGAPATP